MEEPKNTIDNRESTFEKQPDKVVDNPSVIAAREMFESYDKEGLVTAAQRREVEAAFKRFQRAGNAVDTDVTSKAYITAVENLLPPNRLKALQKTIVKLTTLIAIVFALGLTARADNIVTNDATAEVSTNKVTLVSGEVPAATNHPSNVFLNWLDTQLAEKVDIGPTYSGRWERGSLKFNLSVSTLLKTPLEGTWKNVWGKNLSADWVLGIAETYTPGWNEFGVGLGAAVSIWRLPVALHDAQSKIPVVDVVMPKLTILKAFAAVETPVDKLEARIVGGLTLPL